MLKLIRNGASVVYDTFSSACEDAKEDVTFWRETFMECARDGKCWNDFLTGLWGGDGPDEAARLHAVFSEPKTRRWLPMALLIQNCRKSDLWRLFVSANMGDPAALIAYLEDRLKAETNEDLKKHFQDEIAFWRRPAPAAQAAKESIQTKGNAAARIPGDETTIALPGDATMTFCWCPPGEFEMGSPPYEPERDNDETLHHVKLTKGFWMGKHPVTQAQWKAVMGVNPSFHKGKNLPVEYVSWDDCHEFIEKANAFIADKAHHLALPTEAQWEYACRAGTTTPFNFGHFLNGEQANCNGEMPYVTRQKGPHLDKTLPVGKYPPNAWKLHDMHGNVYEWCLDRYRQGFYTRPEAQVDPCCTSGTDTSHALRGGAYCSVASGCRSARRDRAEGSECHVDAGFRLCING